MLCVMLMVDFIHSVNSDLLLRPSFGAGFEKVSKLTNANSNFHVTFKIDIEEPNPLPKQRIHKPRELQGFTMAGEGEFNSEPLMANWET